MEEPELIKMLKYILLISAITSSVRCYPLVTEQPAVVPVPIHHSGEQYSEIVPSLISTSQQTSGGSQKSTKFSQKGSMSASLDDIGSGRPVQMSPVPHISEIQDELSPNNTGGQKHVRQIQQEGASSAPPPSDELCSIFQFFLEPRRYSRCRVSNTLTDNERNEAIPPPSGSPPRTSAENPSGFNFNPNFPRPVSNEVLPNPEESESNSGSDNFQSESENREIENIQQRQFNGPPRMELSRRVDREPPPQQASKRYDQLDEIGGPPPGPGLDEGHHHHLIGPGPPPPPPGPPPMYPKSSLDRTTIIVPERPCRRGERRDHKGYCRRIVRNGPSYQYGPPPPPYGHSRPFRYYHYRPYVSVPTLQFFIPAVP